MDVKYLPKDLKFRKFELPIFPINTSLFKCDLHVSKDFSSSFFKERI
jgi:hypothetical protein